MQIITRRSDPTHRVAFGTRAAAEGFIAAATDPADWTLDNPPDQITPAAVTADDARRDPAGPRVDHHRPETGPFPGGRVS